MKKSLSLLLALTLVLCLSACGAGTQPDATVQPTQNAETAATDAPATEAPVTEAPTESAAYTSDAITLVDDENVTFTVTGFKDNAYLGMEMHVYCENKTDKSMMFSLDGVSVCGVMHEPLWAEEVSAGKKVNSIIYFDTFTLAEQGIASMDEISFRLSVIDNDNWMDEPFVDEHFTVYPTGMDAATVVYPEYRHKNGETVILDNEKLLFIVEKVDDTDGSFYTLSCYIANRTEQDLLVSWDGVSVNGFMVDPFWADAVGAGKQLYTEISFLSSDLAEQGIDTVTEIEFTLTAMDYDNFDMTYAVEETFTFQPK